MGPPGHRRVGQREEAGPWEVWAWPHPMAAPGAAPQQPGVGGLVVAGGGPRHWALRRAGGPPLAPRAQLPLLR